MMAGETTIRDVIAFPKNTLGPVPHGRLAVRGGPAAAGRPAHPRRGKEDVTPPAPGIHVSQVGYMCAARKRVVVPAGIAAGATEFQVQDMGRLDAQALGVSESWVQVFRAPLEPHDGPMGRSLVGDFSSLQRPGVYRAVLSPAGPQRGPGAWSFPFVIADGVYARLPELFLDYVHSQRCGDFEDALRGPCHLDDGLRSDTGEPVDAAGGWHDAGDLRKWMATTPVPILGFFELKNRLGLVRNHWNEKPGDDFLAEAAWGLRWMLKMQDPSTGMFFEDVGGGGDGRLVTGMTWWYENHSGCCADNSGNRFSDNRRGKRRRTQRARPVPPRGTVLRRVHPPRRDGPLPARRTGVRPPLPGCRAALLGLHERPQAGRLPRVDLGHRVAPSRRAQAARYRPRPGIGGGGTRVRPARPPVEDRRLLVHGPVTERAVPGHRERGPAPHRPGSFRGERLRPPAGRAGPGCPGQVPGSPSSSRCWPPTLSG